MALDSFKFMHPTLSVKGSSGEVIFEMKRKGQEYNRPYYIFQIYRDRMTPKEKAGFDEFWGLAKLAALQMGIPLYDFIEIQEALKGVGTTAVRSEEGVKAREITDKTGKIHFVKDIDIKLFDHASGTINTLTVGISIAPKDFGEDEK